VGRPPQLHLLLWSSHELEPVRDGSIGGRVTLRAGQQSTVALQWSGHTRVLHRAGPDQLLRQRPHLLLGQEPPEFLLRVRRVGLAVEGLAACRRAADPVFRALPFALVREATTVTTRTPRMTDKDSPVLILTASTACPPLMNGTLSACRACRITKQHCPGLGVGRTTAWQRDWSAPAPSA